MLGRDSFEVKICACPGRDRTSDEKKLPKPKQESVQEAKKVSPIQSNINLKSSLENTEKSKKFKHIEPRLNEIRINSITKESENSVIKEDVEIFTLKIKGRKNYEILKNLNDALEIQDAYSKLKRINSKDSSDQPKLIKNEKSSVSIMNESGASTKSSIQTLDQ